MTLSVALLSAVPFWMPGMPVFCAQLPDASLKTVDYDLKVVLEEDGRTLRGDLELVWRNPTDTPTQEMWWHVYNNAWEGPQSLWLTEARMFGDKKEPREWGHTEISEVRVFSETGAHSEVAWEWVAQEGAPLDRTVLKMNLPQPVAGGETVHISLHFDAVLPFAFRRSGVDGDGGYIHAVQWFPKVGVFEERDGEMGWNCLPYHYLTEFYADYGDWKLQLTLPERYRDQVAASGTRQLEVLEDSEAETVTYTFLAADIHDFAWTADPDFVVVERSFHELMEANRWRDTDLEHRDAGAVVGHSSFGHLREAQDLYPRDVLIRLMLQPEHAEYEDEYLEATAKSIYYFGLVYGEYPYETISVIDPAHNARRTGGMEYPRLFTGGVRKGNAERTLSPEGITVHEFGHQFWYGLVGNDEFHHAWLDEGFDTFSTQRTLRELWDKELATYSLFQTEYTGKAPAKLGPSSEGDPKAWLSMRRWDSPDLGFVGPLHAELRRDVSATTWMQDLPWLSYIPEVSQDAVYSRRGIFSNDWSDELAKPTYSLLDNGMRRVNAYSRPGLMLETFARLMGEDRWFRTIRAYHERWRYRHPRPDDFFQVLQEFGQGAQIGETVLDWKDLWTQAYDENSWMDFAIHRLVNLGDDVFLELRRHGSFRVPVEVEVVFDDGSVESLSWDGQDDWTRFEWKSPGKKAVSAFLDPQRRLLLDRDWLNNSRTVEGDTSRGRNIGLRALLWAQQVLHYAGGMG
ncbi:MAG: M1 family metallopeptidase [Planctomycetes bacterium]|nr:M1 family metallopeptidase [Planctomycetota bacterium]